jgi:acyl carrier protein
MVVQKDTSSITQEVIAIIAEQLHRPSADIKPENSLDSLGADSLDRVEMVMKLEEHFGIEISDTEAEKIRTVGELIVYIQRLKAQKS